MKATAGEVLRMNSTTESYGYGFTIRTESGKPLLALSYETEEAAKAAKDLMDRALTGATPRPVAQ